ncbi:hypothetical protein NNC19_17930 [Clostridium sp. SHJSY1]|uniref:hypothetical protein n=1 Tax=Clostridium sp. SHJSY1 TaxID=2942483 RepID=UPI002875EF07|nr:hypothetical protein [Clostridium sp. SHJSY1]MDS0527574.1 hypothetical protein [Clostridium sp. SHJSY1]
MMNLKIWQAVIITTLINLLYVYLAFTYNLPGIFTFPVLLVSGLLIYNGGINSIKVINLKTRLKLIALIFFSLLILLLSFSLPNNTMFINILSFIIYIITCLGIAYYFYKKCMEIIGE